MISQSKQKGFTIVELLIVIVVIGILAAISIVAYNNVTQKARDDQRISDARNIINAAAAYQAETGSWPTTKAQLNSGTVVVPTAVTDKITSAGPSSDATKDTYRFQYCGTTAPATAAAATGIRVTYAKEATSSWAEQMNAGSGSTCSTTLTLS